MQVSVTFKNLESSDALRSYVQKKLSRFDKLLDSPAEANVVFSIEKIRHITEVSLSSDKLNIHATEATESMYSSIDKVADKIKHQINKNRDIIKNKHNKHRKDVKHSAMLQEEYIATPDSGMDEAQI